jgi:hypothetical protein
MKVLIVGSGGREHALAWKLAGSTRVTDLYCAPGNPGIAELADLVPIRDTDLAGIEKFVRGNRIELVVVGPEEPLAMGLADRLSASGAKVFGPSKAAAQIDPATRTFLALRMAVNGETQNLAALLEHGPPTLSPGGRMAVISFQSMEDRAVKQAFRLLEQAGAVKLLTKKPLSPTPEEIARNPRARSAKLRVIQRGAASC